MADVPRSWQRLINGPGDVPDLTARHFGPMCKAKWERVGGYGCTRIPGHTGRHAAGTGRLIVAVWTEADRHA